MGGRAGGELAGAVSKAGGLGMLGAARYTTPQWIAEEAAKAREMGGIFCIGLMTWALDDDDTLLGAGLEQQPAFVTLSFGDPAPYVPRVHAAGARVGCQVNTLEDAQEAERAGADVIIAQGAEAGGHTGRVGTLVLLQQILAETSLPVLAAGGIASGRGLAAVLAAGAEGALIGTALLASPEAFGPDYAVDKLIEARANDTVYTNVFDQARHQPWPDRWHGRALANDFTRRWHGAGAGSDEIAAAYDPADPAVGLVYAGEAAGLVRERRAAGQVVAQIAREAEELLSRFR
jgi:nitronate monooxygenase